MKNSEWSLLNEELKRATTYTKNSQKDFIRLAKAWQKETVDDSGRLCGEVETNEREM